MKVIIPGHTYEVSNFEGESTQIIQFIHKEPVQTSNPDGTASVVLDTISNGTTNEELLEVLIDRMQFLNSKFPCRENALVITKLEESLMWLNKRTADRIKRNVEGKHQA